MEPHIQQLISYELEQGGCIILSSIGNKVLNSKGDCIYSINDSEKRILIKKNRLKKLENPSRWVWPND